MDERRLRSSILVKKYEDKDGVKKVLRNEYGTVNNAIQMFENGEITEFEIENLLEKMIDVVISSKDLTRREIARYLMIYHALIDGGFYNYVGHKYQYDTNQERFVNIDELQRRINELKPIAKSVIELRYGISSGKLNTQPETKEALGLSTASVYVIENEALKKLRFSLPKGIVEDAYSEDIMYELEELIKQPDDYFVEYSEPDKSFYKMYPIWDLNLCIGTYNALKRANVNNLADLSTMSEEELMQIKMIGKLKIKEIREKLTLYGLDIRYGTEQVESNSTSRIKRISSEKIQKIRKSAKRKLQLMEAYGRGKEECFDITEMFDPESVIPATIHELEDLQPEEYELAIRYIEYRKQLELGDTEVGDETSLGPQTSKLETFIKAKKSKKQRVDELKELIKAQDAKIEALTQLLIENGIKIPKELQK